MNAGLKLTPTTFAVSVYYQDGRSAGQTQLTSRVDGVWTTEQAQEFASRHLCGNGQYAMVSANNTRAALHNRKVLRS